MRLAMTSRAAHSLLVAALAFLVLPSYGTAQAPRRPAQADTPYRAATRALNEGRFADVDAIAEKHGSQHRGCEGARRRLRADAMPRPKRCCVLSPHAFRRARPRSNSGCCSRCSAGPTPLRCSRRWRRSPTPATIRSRSPAAAARCARSDASMNPTPRTAMRRRRAERRRHPDGVRRSVPGEVRNGRGAEIVPDGAAGRRRMDARAPRRGARARRRKPAAGVDVRQASARGQPIVCGRAHLPRGRGGRRQQARRGAAAARQGAGRQPVEPRCDRAARGAVCTSKTSRRSSRPKPPRRSRSRRATARCTASPAISRRATTASTKRSS